MKIAKTGYFYRKEQNNEKCEYKIVKSERKREYVKHDDTIDVLEINHDNIIKNEKLIECKNDMWTIEFSLSDFYIPFRRFTFQGNETEVEALYVLLENSIIIYTSVNDEPIKKHVLNSTFGDFENEYYKVIDFTKKEFSKKVERYNDNPLAFFRFIAV